MTTQRLSGVAEAKGPSTVTAAPASTRRPWSVRALRGIGWTLIVAGVVVLLYVVYALWFTGFETERAQQHLQQQWTDAPVDGSGAGAPQEEDGGEPGERESTPEADEAAVSGDAVAKLEFKRPGTDEQPVTDEPLFVVHGVTRDDLTRGPGQYPDTAAPGQGGNFAVAGHRTTYGSPFFSLDELREGDEIHVTDPSGQRHVYEFAAREIVSPGAGWVLGDDPLETDRPTLTLTTCHPRFSAAQRMVVFGEAVSRG